MQLTQTRVSDVVPKMAYSVRPPTEEGWALAAVGYVAAIAIYLVGFVIVVLGGWSGGFRENVMSLFGRDFLVVAPATLTAIGVATRRGQPATGAGRWRIDAALTGAIGLLVVVGVGSAIGFLAAFGDFGDSVSVAMYDLLIRAAAFVVCGVGVMWALSELSVLRQSPIELPPA